MAGAWRGGVRCGAVGQGWDLAALSLKVSLAPTALARPDALASSHALALHRQNCKHTPFPTRSPNPQEQTKETNVMKLTKTTNKQSSNKQSEATNTKPKTRKTTNHKQPTGNTNNNPKTITPVSQLGCLPHSDRSLTIRFVLYQLFNSRLALLVYHCALTFEVCQSHRSCLPHSGRSLMILFVPYQS
jgi:hypothetical protein